MTIRRVLLASLCLGIGAAMLAVASACAASLVLLLLWVAS